MDKYTCNNCGYIYDPVKGDPESGIEGGMPFGALPDDWNCPRCGNHREGFEPEGGEDMVLPLAGEEPPSP